MHHSPFHHRPFASLSPVIKRTLLATALISAFCFLSAYLFTHIFHLPPPSRLLSLSKWGIHHGFLWQFVSYLFIEPIATTISLGTLLHTCLHLYLIQWMGSALIDLKGTRAFITLYFGGGLLIALASYLLSLAVPSPLILEGASSSIFILLIAWSFLFPNATVMAFFLFPIRAKWLTFGFVGFNLLISFSNGNFFSFYTSAIALLYGYLYPLLAWEVLSPFPRLHPFERNLLYSKRRYRAIFRKKGTPAQPKATLYSFETGEEIRREDNFVNACLDKISQRGKGSLTFRERWRLWQIARKKKRG